MKTIDISKIIFNYLYQLDKDSVDVKEIIDYSKIIEKKLGRDNYLIERINLKKIISFANFHSVDMFFDNNKIIIRDLNKLKHTIEKYKLNEIDEELKPIFIKPEKYLLPVIVNNNLIMYELLSTNSILKNNKNRFYLTNSDNYLINLEKVSDSVDLDSVETFINKLLTESESIKTNILNYEILLEYLTNIELLTNSKFNDISLFLNTSEEVKEAKEKSIEILECIKASNVNSSYIYKESNLYKKISNKYK